MPMTSEVATLRIVRELKSAEQDIDAALISSATLLATMAQSRIDTLAPVQMGHLAIKQLVSALTALTEARTSVVRTHGQLLKVGQERGDILDGDCPPPEGIVAVGSACA